MLMTNVNLCMVPHLSCAGYAFLTIFFYSFFLLDPLSYMGRASDSVCVSVFLAIPDNRSLLLINLWS